MCGRRVTGVCGPGPLLRATMQQPGWITSSGKDGRQETSAREENNGKNVKRNQLNILRYS
jgi:hypothetical protein